MKTLPILLLLLLSSCAEMDIFARRSYADQMEIQDRPLFLAGEDFEVVPGDTGKQHRSMNEILERTPPSKREEAKSRHIYSLESELKNYESKLNEEQIAKYQREEKHLTGLSERLYYLRLPAGERANYMRLKRGPASYDPGLPLTVGMTKDRVRIQWGPPVKVEFAGNPTKQNERWTYYRDGKLQKVYFEGGSVQGWEL